MVRNSVYKCLIIVVVCLSIVFVVSVLNFMSKDRIDGGTVFSEADFSLEVDLSGINFSVGDKLSGTATITNMSGKNVIVTSNGYMPCTWLHDISDTHQQHPERDSLCVERLRVNDNLIQGFVYEFTESGTFVLYVHYYIEINGVELCSELEDIIIEVK